MALLVFRLEYSLECCRRRGILLEDQRRLLLPESREKLLEKFYGHQEAMSQHIGARHALLGSDQLGIIIIIRRRVAHDDFSGGGISESEVVYVGDFTESTFFFFSFFFFFVV